MFASVVWLLSRNEQHFSKKALASWGIVLACSSLCGTFLLMSQIKHQREQTYNSINEKVMIAKLSINSDSNLTNVSDTFEKGLMSLTAQDKMSIFQKIIFFLHADQTFCENFLESKDFLSHTLISKIKELPNREANEFKNIMAQSIISGKRIEDEKIPLNFLPLENISLITQSRAISSMSKLEKCQFLQTSFSNIFMLRPIIESNFYDSVAGFFLRN